jgi:predicted dehydrogenase
MTKLRVAAVGLGWVTLNRHIPALQRSHEVALVGVIDPRPERVSATAARLKVRSAVGSGPRDIEWLDQIDAVTIGTPPQTHAAIARPFLAAGKHVLLEKPMAMSPLEGKQLVAAAQAAGRTLAVVHNFQFSRAMLRLQQLLQAGELGDLQSIAAVQLSNPKRRLPSWYEQLPMGLFYDEAPHLLYLVRSLLPSEPRIVRADILPSTEGRETPSLVELRFDTRIPVTISMRFEAPLSEWHLAAMGSRRMAVADIFRDVLVVVPNDGGHTATDIMRTTASAFLSHLSGVASSGVLMLAGRLSYGNDEVIRRFVEACRTGQPPAGISAIDGLRIVELQHQVLLSQPRVAA